MNISYETIKPFEPFGMPHSDVIKNSLLLKKIKESIETVFDGAQAAWRLSQIKGYDDKGLIKDAELWMKLLLEKHGAKTVLPKLRQLYNNKGDSIGFTMMVQYRLPNDPERRGEYVEYVHGHEPNRASTAKTHHMPKITIPQMSFNLDQ